MEKYGVDYALVEDLIRQGMSKKDALEKVASGKAQAKPPQVPSKKDEGNGRQK